MSDQPSGFIWYELLTTDLDAAAKFYGAVVGWTVLGSVSPGMDYRHWMAADGTVGGLLAMPAGAGMAPGWLGYLNVADVDASLAAITGAGGAVMMPATDIPSVGRITMASDPQGARFYIMAPAGEGQSHAFAPGNPGHYGWNELHAKDWAPAFEFYQAHFGWGKSDAVDMGPMGTYQLFNTGGDAVGGMFSSQEPPGWLFYVNVDDIDAAKARVESAGGSVVTGPVQVPGGGWILQGRDPQGAVFALVGSRAAG